ncbi:MAG: hypothetical protein KGO96_13110 [Elusimicrobia bacterium]|nr:hypothetical protein [Elusimicrobiota bacterium]
MKWSSGQTTISDSKFSPSSVPGAGSTLLGFKVDVFFWDANGVPMGTSSAQSFSVPIKTEVFYSGVGSITVSPPGSAPNSGGTTSGTYTAYWTVGTQVTVTTSAGVAPLTSAPANICSASGPGFSCSFTTSDTLPVVTIGGGASTSQDAILVYASGSTAASPSEVCLSASAMTLTSPAISCGPSETFTLGQAAGWHLEKQGSGSVLKSGFGTTAKLNFSDYSGQVAFSGALGALDFVTDVPVTLTIQQVTYGTGAQVAQESPSAGTYSCAPGSSVCQPGQSVTVSLTVPSGYYIVSWNVNGQTKGNATSLTVPVPQSGAVVVGAALAPRSCSSNCPPPPPPPPVIGSGSVGAEIAGIVVIGVGLVLPRSKRNVWI